MHLLILCMFLICSTNSMHAIDRWETVPIKIELVDDGQDSFQLFVFFKEATIQTNFEKYTFPSPRLPYLHLGEQTFHYLPTGEVFLPRKSEFYFLGDDHFLCVYRYNNIKVQIDYNRETDSFEASYKIWNTSWWDFP